MKIRLLLLLTISALFLGSITSLSAQNEDRRHWKYVGNLSDVPSTSELTNLSAISWTGACYIGESKAVAFSKGDLFLFDYSVDSTHIIDSVWSRIEPDHYYELNSNDVRIVTSYRPKVNLVGGSLAYVGDNKILLGPARDNDKVNKQYVYYDETWVYDLTDNSWTLMLNEDASIPWIYNYGMCHLVGDKVVAFGGKNLSTSTITNDLYIYDLSDNEWTTMTAPSGVTWPSARHAISMTALGDGTAITFGGQISDGSSLGDTWIFDYADGTPTWMQITTASSLSPNKRYYYLLQKLSSDIAILYGGTTSYNVGKEHYNDLWQFNYDRANKTGAWTDISFSPVPDQDDRGTSDDIADFPYYPVDSSQSSTYQNYRNIDGEYQNNHGGGYGTSASNSSGAQADAGALEKDHWGRYHGKRRATVNAFLGNDRILLHGGGGYAYTNSYGSTSFQHGKTYVFDLGIPDVEIDSISLDILSNETDVYFTVEKLNDDRGESVTTSSIVNVNITFNDRSVSIPVTITLSNTLDVSGIHELSNLPPNTEVTITISIEVTGLGINISDPVTFTTAGGENSLHLVNSNSDGVSGTNDYIINNSDTLTLSEGFSISQWIKLDDANSQFSLSRNVTSSPLMIAITDNEISLTTTRGGNSNTCTAGNLILSDSWHHVVVTFNSNTNVQSIYLDGEEIVEETGVNTGNFTDVSNDLVFDVKRVVNIDEFQLWKTVLTEAQIKTMMYQPIEFSFPDETHGAVDEDKIDNLLWSDLSIYYKADYLDELSPFSDDTPGCVCQITGVDGMSLVNTVVNVEGYFVETNLPYINWTKDATHASLNDFENPDNWFSGMYPLLSSLDTFQCLVVNSNTNGIYPRFNIANYKAVNTLVMRPGTDIDVYPSFPLTVTNKIIYDDGGTVQVENGAHFIIGGDNGASIEH